MPEQTGHQRPDAPPRPPVGPVMPLAIASIGQEVEFVAVQGGRRLQLRLAEVGFRPGVRFRVLARGRPGPFIICLNDTRMMLGHGMVPRILVRPASTPATGP